MPGDIKELMLACREDRFAEELGALPDTERWMAIEGLIFAVLHVCLRDFESQRRLFTLCERMGGHVLPVHFYSPVPTLSEVNDSTFSATYDLGFDAPKQLALIREMSAWAKDLESVPAEGKAGELHWRNPAFSPGDMILYYSMIRHFGAGRVLEVGSGYSSLVARMAQPKRLESIEPFPAPWLAEVVDRLIVSPVQEVPIEEFESLEANDILFIDSTHVVKVGSDVVFLFLRVLPKLKPGVIVHVHDVFLPFEMPESWVRERLIFWNEQYLLASFLAHNRDWEVLAANHWLGRTHAAAMLKMFPRADPPGGGSFWMRRKV